MVPAFGAIAAVMLFSGEGPPTIASRVVAVVVIVSTLPAGAVIARVDLAPTWWMHRARCWTMGARIAVAW